jgi:hypothetical protein
VRQPSPVAQLNLAGVEARPDLDADPSQLIAEGGRAADRPAGAVEDVVLDEGPTPDTAGVPG